MKRKVLLLVLTLVMAVSLVAVFAACADEVTPAGGIFAPTLQKTALDIKGAKKVSDVQLADLKNVTTVAAVADYSFVGNFSSETGVYGIFRKSISSAYTYGVYDFAGAKWSITPVAEIPSGANYGSYYSNLDFASNNYPHGRIFATKVTNSETGTTTEYGIIDAKGTEVFEFTTNESVVSDHYESEYYYLASDDILTEKNTKRRYFIEPTTTRYNDSGPSYVSDTLRKVYMDDFSTADYIPEEPESKYVVGNLFGGREEIGGIEGWYGYFNEVENKIEFYDSLTATTPKSTFKVVRGLHFYEPYLVGDKVFSMSTVDMNDSATDFDYYRVGTNRDVKVDLNYIVFDIKTGAETPFKVKDANGYAIDLPYYLNISTVEEVKIGDEIYLQAELDPIVNRQRAGEYETYLMKLDGTFVQRISDDFDVETLIKLSDTRYLFYDSIDSNGIYEDCILYDNMLNPITELEAVCNIGNAVLSVREKVDESHSIYRYGAVDFDGKVVVEIKYETPLYFAGGYAVVNIYDDSNNLEKCIRVSEAGVETTLLNVADFDGIDRDYGASTMSIATMKTVESTTTYVLTVYSMSGEQLARYESTADSAYVSSYRDSSTTGDKATGELLQIVTYDNEGATTTVYLYVK